MKLVKNPKDTGDGVVRVSRGGSWTSRGGRSAFRNWGTPNNRHGFRVVLELPKRMKP